MALSVGHVQYFLQFWFSYQPRHFNQIRSCATAYRNFIRMMEHHRKLLVAILLNKMISGISDLLILSAITSISLWLKLFLPFGVTCAAVLNISLIKSAFYYQLCSAFLIPSFLKSSPLSSKSEKKTSWKIVLTVPLSITQVLFKWFCHNFQYRTGHSFHKEDKMKTKPSQRVVKVFPHSKETHKCSGAYFYCCTSSQCHLCVPQHGFICSSL